MFVMWANVVLLTVTGILMVPVAVFCLECLASLLPQRRRTARAVWPRPRLAVLLPAHNERALLGATLGSIVPQLEEGDRLVVVADNCTDQTAAVAREYGATVLERNDTQHIGKGYALEFGLKHLEADPPRIVVMMDADCIVHPGALAALAEQVAATGRPAQAVYLLQRPENPQPRDAVSALAFLVKNLVRPTGLARLGLPCLLTGTGMAFPWEVIHETNLASGNIVEDMQLGLDLALRGSAPLLCGSARVTGKLPSRASGALQQRTRWEHGHLRTLLTQVPRLLKAAACTGNVAALALALELAVPPLSLLVMLLMTGITIAGAGALAGAPAASVVSLTFGAVALVGCVVVAWSRHGRDQLPMASLLAAPLYVLWKIPVYLKFATRPETRWVRSERDPDGHATPQLAISSRPNVRDIERALPSVEIGGVRIHAITEAECVDAVIARIGVGKGGVVVTPNLDHLRRVSRDREFASIITDADLVVADGMPLVWASRLQGLPLPERVPGSNLINSLAAAAATHGKSVFLLGGAPGSAEGAAQVLRRTYPTMRLAGVHCPPVGFERNSAAIAAMIAALTTTRPDIIFVALGSPKQERLIQRLRPHHAGAWWIGVGISFSFLAGDVRRAPSWMQRTGLEWAHRLLQEPARLGKRYLIDGIPFAASLLGASLLKGMTRKLVGVGNGMPSLEAVDILPGYGPRPAVGLSASLTNLDLKPGDGQRLLRENPMAALMAGPLPTDLIYHSFVSSFNAELHGPALRATAPSPAGLPLLDGLRAVVLLGGSVTTSPLRSAIGRSIVDLPLDDGRSLIWHWRDVAAELNRSLGRNTLELRLVVDAFSHAPLTTPPSNGVLIAVQRDASAYRGTGGVLRDIAAKYADDDVILVANAAQVMCEPLHDLVVALAQTRADVSFVSHRDGTPSGLMLIRCGALRLISEQGYVDMKEQALPAIARAHHVAHVQRMTATAVSIRTLDDYVAALQFRHRRRLGVASSLDDPLAEDVRPTFAICERGASIHPTARIHDSIVLQGSVVGEGAVLVRSIVCPGARVEKDAVFIDQLITDGQKVQL